MKTLQQSVAAAIATLLMFTSGASAQDLRTLLDLRGTWKFQIGDNLQWATPGFNDSRWDGIKVPSAWEDQGFPGYDGFGWYRKHFEVPRDWSARVLYLLVGSIDDADEVYVNGRMVGFMGGFPPAYMTAYNFQRKYRIPAEYLRPGADNIIAVRVYDDELSGGILSGPVEIAEDKVQLIPDLPIASGWKFRTGDDMSWKDPSFNDRDWKDIVVPTYWETQGYREYDGYGWYRVRFTVPDAMVGQTLILLAGKIDDFDETYLNGQRIGRTGRMPSSSGQVITDLEYLQQRAYTIPPDLLVAKSENVLAVRVYDGFMHGGIYDGAVGITTRERYQQWKDRQPDSRSGIRRFIDWMFR